MYKRQGVDRFHFLGVLLEVEELPFVEVIEVHQFVAAVSHAVVPSHRMVLGEAIIVVVDRFPPVGWFFPLEKGFQAIALHVGWWFETCQVQKSLSEIQIGNQKLGRILNGFDPSLMHKTWLKIVH